MNQKSREQLTRLRNRLELYYEAEEKILNGQSYTIGDLTLTRADLGKVNKKIEELEVKISTLEKRGTTKRKVARIIPID